jgi:hypothetical protein
MDMITIKAICLEQIVQIWDDRVQTHFNSIGNVKLSANEGDLVEDTTMYKCMVRSLIYMTITRPYFELCSWSGESIHANNTKTTFGCNEAHTKVHKTYFVMWNFL